MEINTEKELQDMLNQKYGISYPVSENFPVPGEKSNILKASKNATLEDFISMVAKVVNKALAKYNVRFIPDEGAILHDPKEKLDQPTILYNVISRVPKKELKPRHCENITDSSGGSTRHGHVWMQRFDCIVQFNVFASDYATANKVMKALEEDVLFAYSGYFKNNGVDELYFKKGYTDHSMDEYRQYVSVRSSQYYVEVSRLMVIWDTTLQEIGIV